MEWNNILQNKKQTFLWRDKIPDRDIIHTILDELHTHCNSKQNDVPYRIEVLDWSNEDRRIELFQKSWCEEDTLSDRRNPQILSPYLLLFYSRNLVFANPEEQSYTDLEIGIAGQFIALSAVNHGLDIGFCACINESEIRLGLGLGYATPVPHEGNYLNPLTGKRCHIREKTKRKPGKNEYIQWCY